jgi:hypothetical protein
MDDIGVAFIQGYISGVASILVLLAIMVFVGVL